jgi:hypothetical protein
LYHFINSKNIPKNSKEYQWFAGVKNAIQRIPQEIIFKIKISEIGADIFLFFFLLLKRKSLESPTPLQITGYLSKITGYVQIPF